MRVAIISDIHGNMTALQAVLADLRQAMPDLVLHGGDLAANGSSPVEVIDTVRELGWHGVMGNTDEMLFDRSGMLAFAEASLAFRPMHPIVEEMAAWTANKLGEKRRAWLEAQPRKLEWETMALVHASPHDLWRAPLPNALDKELIQVYGPLNRPLAVYGHIHRPYVRLLHTDGVLKTIANTGSAGLPHDGINEAAYLLVDDGTPVVRRVAYSVEQEVEHLRVCGLPYAEWAVRMLQTSQPQMPSKDS